jgi:hypothetical protein
MGLRVATSVPSAPTPRSAMKTQRTSLVLVLVTGLGALGAAACTNYYDEHYVPLVEGTGGTGGIMVDPGCIPSSSGSPVQNDCGVFVSASKGDDGNTGTKESPFATIGKALSATKGKPVYLCGETFGEAVEASGDAVLYGALDCAADWAYSAGQRTTIAPAADAIPLKVTSSVSVELHDVNLTAADATAPGGHSIALLAQAETAVTLTRSDLTAGNGAVGADGEPSGGTAASGGDGDAGAEACTGAMLFGGASVTNSCGTGDSISGLGGIGAETSGGDGSDGSPAGTMNGGQGEAASACTDGTAGDDGADGSSGAGASGLGTLTNEGVAGVAGNDGQPGAVAQGGGGGGGAKGGPGSSGGMKECGAVMGAAGNAGASGGSGGAGGCGGAGGKGGGAGGSSIGIVSLEAKLTFEAVIIKTANGATGGNGGGGQAGGAGGTGGPGGNVPAAATSLSAACAGGDGGTGGTGGRGGGGLGGHSIGIAHSGTAPSTAGAEISVGTPGDGGAGDGGMGNGNSGVAAPAQQF